MHLPMKGVRVLEVAQFWFVPSAGAVLADWGADVIKVEHPERGDGQRGLANSGISTEINGVDFLVQQPNRGKRSLALDFGKPEGLALLYRLAERADVFLTNFLPDARERLKIDVEDIRKVNPNIIYVRGHGQGARGPEAHLGGYDASSFWSRGGICNALTPPGAEQPTGQRAAFGDGIGGMTIAGGISAALFQRERTGEAAVVDISLLNTAMWVLSPDIIVSGLLPPEMKSLPTMSRKNNFNPAVNVYPTKDGRWLMLVMLQTDRYWPDFCERIGRPDLATDPRFRDMKGRFENREACIAELDEVFTSRTLDDWREALGGMEGPWAPVQTARELLDDPQSIANGYVQEVDGGKRGRFNLVTNPVQFDETPPVLSRGPEWGEHTDEVLQSELGLEMEELLTYKANGVIL
jgi:crotonobetainyl-CoA:carnitine CoA-transferase CaiB-like acyl-CoA transferase